MEREQAIRLLENAKQRGAYLCLSFSNSKTYDNVQIKNVTSKGHVIARIVTGTKSWLFYFNVIEMITISSDIGDELHEPFKPKE